MSRLALIAQYIFIVAPAGLFLRLAGRDPLNRKRPAGKPTWVKRTG